MIISAGWSPTRGGPIDLGSRSADKWRGRKMSNTLSLPVAKADRQVIDNLAPLRERYAPVPSDNSNQNVLVCARYDF